MTKYFNRRDFLRTSALSVPAMGLSGIMPSSSLWNPGQVSPSDKVLVGLVGCKGMGWSNLRSMLKNKGVECIALCDVDQSILDMRSNDLLSAGRSKPLHYRDYRKLLENKDIDIVILATPDHWHCLIAVDVISAGKHLYIEKPLANSINECNIILDASRKSNVIIQVGQWQRSGAHYRNALEYFETGELGNIRLVKTWSYQGWLKSIPVKPDSAVPEGVDYKMWLGPARKRNFNSNRFHFTWRWFWDYAGGLMSDWGVHEIDIALWFMGAIAPNTISASGGKFAYPDDAAETPDTLQAMYTYDNFSMLWEHAIGIDGGNYGKTEGIAFIGNNGTLVVNRQGWEVIPETANSGERKVYKLEAIPYQEREESYLDTHTENFVQAIRDNNPEMVNCPVEAGAIAAINAHMGNVAFKTGKTLHWDEAIKGFDKDKAANAFLAPEYHNGWKLPG